MAKLTEQERDFLTRVRDSRPLRIADRKEDRVRQRVKKLGFAECVMGPRRWVITDAGRAALERSEG
ncbi:hypothetical protein [Rhizobium sp. Root651]|uniref:hypothetical protein n=1 Tax=Rhizobium sp. Root651 TaxID=1736577 RepID=UPI000712891A|nr:hypothetical protein [Rhizobium sp. Root651]KRA58221.1 hypothetical protein ASD85_17230 [Rhizobium sp. Root651]